MDRIERARLRNELAQWALVLILWVVVASLTTSAFSLVIHFVTGGN
jgi:hypothetical protein